MAERSAPTNGLPSAPLATGTADVAGERVAIRSLTRADALHLRSLAGAPDGDRIGEVYLIARGTGVDEEQAAAWWEASDPGAVQALVLAIARLSRLAPGEDGKSPQ